MSSPRPPEIDPNYCYSIMTMSSVQLPNLVPQVVSSLTTEVEESFKQLLTYLRADAKHVLADREKAALAQILHQYIVGEDVSAYRKITDVYNAIVDCIIQESQDVDHYLKEANNKLSKYPAIQFILEEADFQKASTKEHATLCKLLSILHDKFPELHDIAEYLNNSDNHHINDAPYSHSYNNTKKNPYDAFTIKSLPKFLDTVLQQHDPITYEEAKKDPIFIASWTEQIRARREFVYTYAISRGLLDLYRCRFYYLINIPHLFHGLFMKAAVYPEAGSLDAFLPHPFLLNVLKTKSSGREEKFTDNGVIPQLFAKILQSEIYPNLNKWDILPKITGKEPGFVLASQDHLQKLYVKQTDNMFNELLCANILTRLGIKVAETQLLARNKKQCYLATQGLNRKYEKAGQTKQKLFQLVDEITPISDTCGTTLVSNILAKSDQSTQVSYAKLIIAGFIVGLTDLGAHLGNMGIITATKSNSSRVKWAIVDYQFEPRAIQITSLDDLYSQVKNYVDRVMIDIFKKLFASISGDDMKQAIQQLLKPKAYTLNDKGYRVTATGEPSSTFEVALPKALEDTMKELKSKGIESEMKDEIASFEKNYNLVLENLRVVAKCVAVSQFGRLGRALFAKPNMQS